MLCPFCLALFGCPVCFGLYAGLPVSEQGATTPGYQDETPESTADEAEPGEDDAQANTF